MRKQAKKNKNAGLARAYYTPQRPGAYGGVEALRRATKKIKKSKVKDWLSYQDTYTLHKPVRHTFPRRRIIVGGIDHQWQADLIDVRSLKKANDGFVFLLTCIDVLSKFAWVVPLKDKTGATLVGAFDRIFKPGRKPLKLQTDKGTEFRNRVFQHFLKERGVDFFTTQNEDIKASIVERFNRTFKEKMWRYFTRKQTVRYVDVLPQLLRAYNHSYHRSIKRTPAEVTKDNQEEVWETLFSDTTNKTDPPDPRLDVGDHVRISKARRTFKKGYLASWTEELFTVSRIKNTRPVTYMIKDAQGEQLEGTFYEQELQKVGEKETFRVETVLKQRKGASGQPEYLVKWYGYASSFNSWIPQTALTTYTH